MPKQRKRVDLDKYLAEAEPRIRSRRPTCLTCAHEEARDLLAGFMVRRREGTTSVSLMFFHEDLLAKLPGYEAGYAAVQQHVRKCLGLDVRTGQPR